MTNLTATDRDHLVSLYALIIISLSILCNVITYIVHRRYAIKMCLSRDIEWYYSFVYNVATVVGTVIE